MRAIHLLSAMSTAIDRAELAAQTFGDAALAAEILAMFAAQTPPLLQALAATSGPARAEVAHRLKGSSLAIGARDLAEAAAALEAAPDDAARLAALERASAAVMAEIAASGSVADG
jgi:HPt (histidine-containing phosphotransfer) domain-containing protein